MIANSTISGCWKNCENSDRKKNLIEREQVWKRLVSSWCRKEEEISDLFNKANQVKERERWLAEQEKILARLYKEVGHSREAWLGRLLNYGLRAGKMNMARF